MREAGIAVGIRRVVPDITTADLATSRDFYTGLLGFEVAMDLGWVVTLASPTNPTAQITLVAPTDDPVHADISIEVDDVDAVHAQVTERHLEIVYPLTDEDWGVRRFFVRDPNGVMLNIVSHRSG